MQTDANAPGGKRPGFLTRFLMTLRYRIRRMFGKTDDPNIYPFF